MNSYELLAAGFLNVNHESQVRICEELGLVTQKDLALMVNVANWMPLWRKAFRTVWEKGMHEQLWEALHREGVVYEKVNPFQVAELVAEVTYGVSSGYSSRAEMVDEKLKAQAEREKQSLKDLSAAGLDVRSKSARAERLSEQAAAMLGMAPEEMDACNDVNTKTVERLRDLTEKLEATARGRQIKEEITRIFQMVSNALGLPASLMAQSEESNWSASREWFKSQQEAEPPKSEGIDAEFESPVKDYVSAEEIYARLVDRYRSWEFTQDGKIFSFDVDLDGEEDQVRLVNYQDRHYCWMVVLYPMPAGKVNAVCVSGRDDIKNAYGLAAEHIEEERLGERVIDVQAIFNGEDWWTNGPEREISFAFTWAFTAGKDRHRHWWLHGAGHKTACGKMLDIYDHPSAPIREQPTACACPDCRKAWDRLIGEGSQTDETK